MAPKNRVPTHPGEMLLEEFLEPLGLTPARLAETLGVPVGDIDDIIAQRRGVTPEVARSLASAFGTSQEFWTNLQAGYDRAR